MQDSLTAAAARIGGHLKIEPWVLIVASGLAAFGVPYCWLAVIVGIGVALLWELISHVDHRKASVVICLSIVASAALNYMVEVGWIAGLGGTVTGVITYVILRRRQSF